MRGKPYLRPEYTEEILKAVTVECKLADGVEGPAQLKFEFDTIRNDPRLLTLAANAVSRCIQNEFDRPNAIVTIADAATCMGDPIVRGIEGRHIRTAYQDTGERKLFYLMNNVKPNEKVIVIDDMYASGESMGNVINLLIRNGAIPMGAVVLFNQSGEEAPQCKSLPVHYVIQKALQ